MIHFILVFGNVREQLPQVIDGHAERRSATTAHHYVARVRVIFKYGLPYSKHDWKWSDYNAGWPADTWFITYPQYLCFIVVFNTLFLSALLKRKVQSHNPTNLSKSA